ncbi:MAG: hypothetical protein M0Z58_08080 [Nitrospiraceae bacterium]|nr:hypothetical protein [Nitrospiraceae bacterium]
MDEDHEKMVLDKLLEEERRGVMLTGFIRENVYEFLTRRKGYREEEIEVDVPFEVSTEREKEVCSVDFIVKAAGRRIIAIKCALSALESIERHALAFSRVAGGIPISVVTSSDYSRVLDTETGRLVSEELASIPDRAAALSEQFRPLSIPEERLRMERRILLAFNTLACRLKGACGEDQCRGVH